MPYIPPKDREQLRKGRLPETKGELNYAITKMLLSYIFEYKGESYDAYCDVVGTLDMVKQEMYRRAVAPYEDVKVIENGDLFPEKYEQTYGVPV